ncbi:MAG: hypothetical protein M1826_002519 [Phylliscum demangeonii]|nr:MAG: hypothetical protein M1826_002519 [Phylliscum demangeonii]
MMIERHEGVIHAGLYYGASTLKTKLCVLGRSALYSLCARRAINHRRTKKWIVAQTDAQWDRCLVLHEAARAMGAGVVPTRLLSPDEARRREPDVRAERGAVQSEETGIVDSHGLMMVLQADVEESGGDCAFRAEVVAVEALQRGQAGYRLTVRDGGTGQETSVTTETLVNSAGLFACQINNMLLPADRHRTPYFAKGSYFAYNAAAPRPSLLIYPAPEPGLAGLGTHLTLDLAGRIRFGPDVEWVDDPTDLTPRPDRLEQALREVRRYLPGVDPAAVVPDYCGIRPKLSRTGAVAGSGDTGVQDFVIQKEEGLAGFVNLLGIESPGLTSCLAIGDMVESLLYR